MGAFLDWLALVALVWGFGILIGITLGAFALQWSMSIVKRYLLPTPPAKRAPPTEDARFQPTEAGPYTSPASGYEGEAAPELEQPLPALDQNEAFYLAAKCAAGPILVFVGLRSYAPHLPLEWQGWALLVAWLGAGAALAGCLAFFLSTSLARAALITAVFIPIYAGLWFLALWLLAGRLLGTWLDRLFGW